jgi:hypothetical protein
MTFEHILYIPGVLLIGTLIGYSLGAKAVRREQELAKKRARR